MGIFRWNFNRITHLAVAATLAGTLTASSASAQAAEGNWGVEGRIGGGQTAYLLRWFNPAWSLVLGGGFNMSTVEQEPSNTENTTRSASLVALLRKEWGTGRARPHIGFGPTLNLSHTKSESSGASGNSTAESDNNGFGGRFEFGVLARVTQSVDLGLSMSATGQRIKLDVDGTQVGGTTGATTNQFSFGTPQLVMRVRF